MNFVTKMNNYFKDKFPNVMKSLDKNWIWLIIANDEGCLVEGSPFTNYVLTKNYGHYYILCLFAKVQTKNLKGLRSKNKKPKGFAKQKQFAIFAMRHASQLVVHHPSLIYNVPLIIVTLLRHIQQKKLYNPFSLCPP